jgi:REP element-mobilizing transposase RayT
MAYYERHLPHWQPEGAALFITWRLHGSLPREVNFLGHRTAGREFASIDCELARAATGPRWLADERVAQSVLNVLEYGERELHLYELRAWVLMVNHVHILIDATESLRRITQSVKNYSARRANAVLGRTGQPFWHHESYDHWVRNPDEMERIVRYIEGNPVAAGLVQRSEDFRWSSAHK